MSDNTKDLSYFEGKIIPTAIAIENYSKRQRNFPPMLTTQRNEYEHCTIDKTTKKGIG